MNVRSFSSLGSLLPPLVFPEGTVNLHLCLENAHYPGRKEEFSSHSSVEGFGQLSLPSTIILMLSSRVGSHAPKLTQRACFLCYQPPGSVENVL